METFKHISEVMSPKFEGKEARVRGWIHRKRSGGGMQFIVVRDSTGIIQVAVKKDAVGERAWNDAEEALIESSVNVNGIVKSDKRAPGGYELAASDFSAVQKSEIFPISKDQSTEFLLDVRHLWLRSQKLTNIMKARHHIVAYLREFFYAREFWELAPPIITKSGCEGGSTLFNLKYFDTEAYLTQSGQLYNEAFITALEKVFVLAPSFRAEPSRTVRHLTEYWHLEPEMAYYDNKMNMELQEEMIEYVCQKLAKEHAELLLALGRKPEDLQKVKKPFKRMSYADAIDFLAKKGMKIAGSKDFGADEEEALTKGLDKPVFVHNYPKSVKAFYMREDPDNPGTALCADLLAPEGHGEIIGGSERIWQLDELLARMKEEKMNTKDYEWYIDLRRYGSVPHSGFGLGIERLVKWLLNLDHIRDAIPFPRTINRVYP